MRPLCAIICNPLRICQLGPGSWEVEQRPNSLVNLPRSSTADKGGARSGGVPPWQSPSVGLSVACLGAPFVPKLTTSITVVAIATFLSVCIWSTSDTGNRLHLVYLSYIGLDSLLSTCWDWTSRMESYYVSPHMLHIGHKPSTYGH